MTWLRRAVTIPGLFVLWIADLLLLPALLATAFVVDLARGRSFAWVRFHLAVAFALAIHVLGLFLILAAWLAGLLSGRSRERDLDARSEVWWAKATWSAAARLYGMHLQVEGEEALDGGPLVLMSRHASLLDVLLPIVTARGRLLPRFVAKRALLWDPCIDLLGHRLATAFVRRGGRAHEADLEAVESLADHLGPRDAVVIFPEGTRFSPEKRARALAALATRDDRAFARASRLENLLPPHLAGPLGVLEHARGADVVFCAHTGLEGASHLGDLVNGSLIDTTVRIRYWRVAATEIPPELEARTEWLWQWWERIDAWLGGERDGTALASTVARHS